MNAYKLNGLLISCIRGFERDAASEAWWMLSSIMEMASIDIDPTEVPGLVYASFDMDPRQIMMGLRIFLEKHLDEFRFCLKFIPIQEWVTTDLNLICNKVSTLSHAVTEEDSWRIMVKKRYSSLNRKTLIEQAALHVPYGKGVSLEHPDKIIRIEIVGRQTGISILTPNQMISLEKLRRSNMTTES